MLPIILDAETIQQMFDRKQQYPDYRLIIDLAEQRIIDEHGLNLTFEIDPVRKRSLLEGLDDIGLTLQHEHKIAEFEARSNMKPVA